MRLLEKAMIILRHTPPSIIGLANALVTFRKSTGVDVICGLNLP